MEPCAQGHAARRTGPQAQNPKVTLLLTLQLHVTVMPRGAPIPKPTMSYRVTGAMGLKRHITPVLENLSYAASDGQPAFLSRFYEGIWQMGVWQQISLEKHTVTVHETAFTYLTSLCREVPLGLLQNLGQFSWADPCVPVDGEHRVPHHRAGLIASSGRGLRR